MRPADNHGQRGPAGGTGLPGPGDEGHGEVLLEVGHNFTAHARLCVYGRGVYSVEGLTSWFLCPRVSWRRAPGVISFDDSLFKRWRAPLLDRLVLDPVREEDSGDHRRQYL